MIALRRPQIEARIPWECGACPPEVLGTMGCAPGTVASEPLRFKFGGRSHETEVDFDRCPLATLRDASPDALLWVDWSIRLAVAKEQGCVRVEDYTPGEMVLIHLAEDVRARVQDERLAEIQDEQGGHP